MKCHSMLFAWSKYGTPDAALEAARVYRDEWIEKNKSMLWLRPEGARYSAKLQSNNTSGILGVNRTSQILKSGTMYSAWQASINQVNGTTKNHSYSVNKYGEIGAMRMAIKVRLEGVVALLKDKKLSDDESIKALAEYYTDILSNLEEAKDEESTRSIVEIASDDKISPTAKYDEICVRIGQQKFRRLVLECSNHECVLTGAKALIRASHIKPWRHSSDVERIDPMNGLALSPLYDAAFDSGVISFRQDGIMLVCEEFLDELIKLGLNKDLKIRHLKSQCAQYLDWHRKHVYKGHTSQANPLE